MDVIRLKTIRELKSTSGKKTAYFLMKSEESINIDSLMDFKVAEVFMQERMKDKK
jgi:CMP-N-acetylneuraminic acid synthetase